MFVSTDIALDVESSRTAASITGWSERGLILVLGEEAKVAVFSGMLSQTPTRPQLYTAPDSADVLPTPVRSVGGRHLGCLTPW